VVEVPHQLGLLGGVLPPRASGGEQPHILVVVEEEVEVEGLGAVDVVDADVVLLDPARVGADLAAEVVQSVVVVTGRSLKQNLQVIEIAGKKI
jgi:hypothetical protein